MRNDTVRLVVTILIVMVVARKVSPMLPGPLGGLL